MGERMIRRVRVCMALQLLLIAVAIAPALAARPSIMTPQGSPLHAGEFVVALNKSEIIQVDQPFSELLVGNPKIADVLALTDRTIYVLGHAIGTTNLTIYGPNKRLIAVVDLIVSFDVEGLKVKLFEVLPDEKIEVRTVNGTLLLSGRVTSASHLNEALAIAARFAP